jgi:hypothetical protein
MAVAGGVALSVTLTFAFTPQMFVLTQASQKEGTDHRSIEFRGPGLDPLA